MKRGELYHVSSVSKTDTKKQFELNQALSIAVGIDRNFNYLP